MQPPLLDAHLLMGVVVVVGTVVVVTGSQAPAMHCPRVNDDVEQDVPSAIGYPLKHVP